MPEFDVFSAKSTGSLAGALVSGVVDGADRQLGEEKKRTAAATSKSPGRHRQTDGRMEAVVQMPDECSLLGNLDQFLAVLMHVATSGAEG